uniref:DNA-directed RNA polymerase subunit beta n=1 Tax=Chenopodium quinoa TaxID=63459 RepID=A0A803LYS4_CHEQI
MGTSSNGKDGFDDIDLDNWDDEDMYSDDDADTIDMCLHDLGEVSLMNFCKKASSSFFKQHGLISHQINSCNSFVREGIKRVFDNIGEITVNPGYDSSKKGEGGWRYASVRFGKFELERPMFWTGEKFQADGGKDFIMLLPRHARLQKMTYSARLKVETHLQIYTQEKVISDKFKTGKSEYIDRTILHDETTDVIIGRIPVMVKSDICWMSQAEKGDCEFDHGGYFIVKGAEKTFIAQEQICLNRLWISSEPWKVAYRSEFRRRSLHVKLVENPKVENIQGGEKVISVYFAFAEVPIWILFFALGVSFDKEVVELIDCSTDDGRISNILFASIHDADEKCDGFRRGGKALEHIDHIIRQSKFPPSESAADIIETNLFPGLSGNKQKARFLGYMRDLYGNRDLQAIEHYLDASIVTNGLTRAFSTGAWAHPFKKTDKVSGVTANLRRTNPLQSTCDMRRTRQQVAYTGKVGDASCPHPSHWGKVCFLSTPDGENCGLVKNIAATGLVSCSISKKDLPDILVKCGMEKLMSDTCTSLSGKDNVFVDGDWVGVCADSLSFVQELRRKRRKKRISSQVEIIRDVQNSEVRIFCDAGRILRPLLVVKNLKKTSLLKGDEFSFETLLDKGIIELIGPEEEEDCRVAWGIKFLFEDKGKDAVKYTHCELDMSFLLGVSCGIIPFANHDHAKRVLHQSQKHSGQAFGYSSTNPNIRVDTLSHQMYYPQRPLFRSVISDCLGKPGYPLGRNQILPKAEFFNGQNGIVAVNVHLGYNQEDSLVMSRASLERGMFSTEHIRSYKAEVDNQESTERRRKFDDIVKFGKIQSKIGRADNLDDDGFPYIGANLQSGDIIIGRCAESGADHSVKLKHTERGMVQKVVLSANDDGKNFAVVSLRQVRSPRLGDKFSSMHGQKGVIGYLESQENFPFTKQGIVPDIVINPHSFPNRQTPGQLLEAALGKGIACGGSLKYATPFSTPSVESIKEQLHRAGFSRWGNERVYNGRTGEMIRTLIFMGPTFYQRLNRMSEDEVKYRNTGPVHPLTRQPVQDRKRFGGIRFGAMEQDCLIAHGASANLHERLFTLSDASQMHVCRKCKNIANVIQRTVPGGKKIRGPYCRFCESGEEIVKLNVPYGAKLLCQELFSMGISLRFDTQLC